MEFAEYLVKVSIGLGLIYVFYILFLSRLTFYRWNRYYLLVYPLSCFFLPFLNVSEWLNDEAVIYPKMWASIPSVDNYIAIAAPDFNTDFLKQAVAWIFIAGAFVCVARMLIQYLSFIRTRRSAVLMHSEGNIKIYSTSSCGAFSFGNEIYVQTQGHTDEELQRILLHELVHVKEQHTVDLVLSEILCIINWFNPVAWLIRKAIRRNLEYIADNNVLERGHDVKEYQYLLLKVTGISDFRIASHFNIADLKKRIAMMNKIKSDRLHLVKFAFILPVIVFLLVAFRNVDIVQADPLFPQVAHQQNDTVPANDKYLIHVIHSQGEDLVLIRDKSTDALLAMTMKDWMKNRKANEEKYGKLPPPLVPPAPPVPPVPAVAPEAPAPPVAPEPPVKPSKIKKGDKSFRLSNDEYEELAEAVLIQHEQNLVHLEKALEQLKVEQQQQVIQLQEQIEQDIQPMIQEKQEELKRSMQKLREDRKKAEKKRNQ